MTTALTEVKNIADMVTGQVLYTCPVVVSQLSILSLRLGVFAALYAYLETETVILRVCKTAGV